MMWQIRKNDENGKPRWVDVTAPWHWHDGKFYVDWPDDSVENVSFRTVEYRVTQVRQKPRSAA